MKKISLILLIIMAIFVTSCEKDKENVVIKSTIDQNSMNNLSPTTIVLLLDDKDNNFQTLKWSEVDYGFDAVITYVVQFDKKANNFSTPNDLATVTSDTTLTVMIGDLNKALLTAGLDPEVAVDIQFRVKATIHPTVEPVYSTAAEAKITPYATSFPPIYMCGGAVGGWNWNLYTYKELRSSAPNVYTTIAYFVNNDIFRFFKQTDWGPTSWQFPYFTGTVTPLLELNPSDGDNNCKFVGTSGYYEITVNMSTKSIAMTAVAEPVLYATGAALGGWDWSTNYIQLTWKANGIFQATTDFAVETFRFFKQAGWGDAYNYPWFAGGTVSALFENANDGDSNFKFIGTPGSYKITVNLLDKIVTMEAVVK